MKEIEVRYKDVVIKWKVETVPNDKYLKEREKYLKEVSK